MASHRRAGISGFFPILVLAALVSAALITFPAKAEQEAEQEEARRTVERLHDSLLSAMKDADSLGYWGRVELLSPVVRESFNLPYMARLSSGYRWKKAGRDDQKKLIDAFTNMTIANYASRFDGFSGEAFETLGVAEGPRGAVIVKTQLVKGDGEKVALDYVLQAFDGQWRIVDIFLKGTFSEMAIRRSEYSSLIKRGGFDGLISAIEDKTTRIEKKAEAP